MSPNGRKDGVFAPKHESNVNPGESFNLMLRFEQTLRSSVWLLSFNVIGVGAVRTIGRCEVDFTLSGGTGAPEGAGGRGETKTRKHRGARGAQPQNTDRPSARGV